MERTIVETIVFIPQREAFHSRVIHGMGDIHKMIKELASNIAIVAIFLREFQRNRQHIQAIHRHPTGPIGLLNVGSIWQPCVAIEDTNIIQTQEASLKDILPVVILDVHPPHKVKEELLKDFFKKITV